MAHKTIAGGTAYAIKGGKTMVGGTSFGVKKGKTMVDGTVYEIGFGQAISELAVGASVFMNVNGAEKEFLIVHQGKPSTLYDDSCDGTWLLIKDLYESRAWHSSDANEYSNSTIHSYLNSTFLALFDSNIQTAIKEVKIPYSKYNATNGTFAVASGANGLAAKIFLLSLYEVGFDKSVSQFFLEEGAKLDYFESGDTSGGTNRTKRIAYLNGTASAWWTRSADTLTTDQAFYIRSTGSYGYYYCSNAYRIRPALILPGDTLVDDNFKVIT